MADYGDQVLTIDDIERIVEKATKEIGRDSAQEICAEEARSQEVDPGEDRYACAHRGRRVRFRGNDKRTIVTALGILTVPRRIYYCARCDMDTAPVDKAMRLPGHGYTARVEQMVADLGADEVSEKVFKRLERLTRIRLSAKDS